MKQIIFATGNPTKAKKIFKRTSKKRCRSISIKRHRNKINVKEDGKM